MFGRDKDDVGGRHTGLSKFDAGGPIGSSRRDLDPPRRVYAQKTKPTEDLATVVKDFKATALVGLSTPGGAFTEDVVEAVAENSDRPIVFRISSPTDKAECTPEQAYKRIGGEALVACGVQFPDVTVNGETRHPGRADDVYIVPALASTVDASGSKRITDRMFLDAAKASADQVSRDDREHGMPFPPRSKVLDVETIRATRVAEATVERGGATVERPKDVRAWIESLTCEPEYP